MKRIAITTALALAIAAPAFANDQLARSLGVEPGAFTAAELATLHGLRSSGDSIDRRTADVLADRFAAGVVSTQSVASPASTQLAANLGLDADGFSTAELAEIKGVIEQGDSADAQLIADLVAKGERGVVSTQSVESPAGAQLAANLGLDAGEFTVAELAAIKGRIELDRTDN